MGANIGRNNPCPCGSGKKYKKCCIDRPTSQFETERSLSGFRMYEDVDELSTEEIIKMLRGIGIAFEKEKFMKEVDQFYSAR